MTTIRWKAVATCSHSNSEVCKFCDFDGYYAGAYPECPWAVREEA